MMRGRVRARVPPPPTQRLYLEDAARKTALAQVTAHAHGGFTLDRTVFHAADTRYHHVQPEDRGHILADGHKLKVPRVFWDRGTLVHRTTGPLPPVGAKAQLHLDADRRAQNARAHTAMHLLVAALAERRAELVEPPRVVGGGEVRLHARLRDAPADAVPAIVARAMDLAQQRLDVEPRWAPRDDAARLVTHHVIGLDAVAPGEPTLRLVRIGDASTLPCDAPLLGNTRDIGMMRASAPQARRDGVRWGVKIA